MENKIELKPFDKVLVRNKITDAWIIDLYEKHKESSSGRSYSCLVSIWVYCIPYEGNEHLLGTTDSPQKDGLQEAEKQGEVSDNYGYPVECFKRNDVVLCRDAEDEEWRITSFVAKGSEQYPFQCLFYRWKNCIPYEGNEHLLGTTDAPGRYDPNENTLFGIEIKPGYVLEFEYGKIGVIFPIREISSPQKKRLALMYTGGAWVQFEFIDSSKVIAIRGLAYGSLLTNGELLWERAKKQSLTKLEIAEKLGMKVKDFEIVNE